MPNVLIIEMTRIFQILFKGGAEIGDESDKPFQPGHKLSTYEVSVEGRPFSPKKWNKKMGEIAKGGPKHGTFSVELSFFLSQ